MKMPAISPVTVDRRAAADPAFSVVMVYADFAAGQRAMQTCKSLITRFGQDFEFQTHLWKFDMLRFDDCRQLAASQATAADMIILSLGERNHLPEATWNWVEDWLPERRDRPGALVALLRKPGESSAASLEIQSALEMAARRGGLTFFAHEFDPPEPDLETKLHWLDHRANTVSSVLEEILHQPAPEPHWGINE